MPVKILLPHAFELPLGHRMAVPFAITAIRDQTDAEIREALDDMDVIVHGAYKPEWGRKETKRPLLVHSPGAGIDGIALDHLPARSIVCNVYGHERGVAEQAFLHMIALHRRLFAMDRALRVGNWTPEVPLLPEMRDRNLLVLGLGHIGQELVRWGKFLGMNVTALTRSPATGRAAKLGLTSFGSLGDRRAHLPTADFAVIALPSARETADLIGADELGMMKPTAFIVNVGRAPVINERALYEALRNRQIAGAGLDVWYQYPAPGQNRLPASLPFHELDNVIMTPHKPTIETMEYRWKEIAMNIARHAAGERPVNVVWPVP